MNKIQIIIRLAILISPFFLPWWLVVIFVCAALFFYDRYYEIFLISIILDSMYSTQHTSLGVYAFTLGAFGLYIAIHQIKKRLLVY